MSPSRVTSDGVVCPYCNHACDVDVHEIPDDTDTPFECAECERSFTVVARSPKRRFTSFPEPFTSHRDREP